MGLKLLREEVDFKNFEILTEDKNGKKDYFIKGPMIVGEVENANKRKYKVSLLEREVTKFQKKIEEGRAAGELNHPQSPEINPERIAHYVMELNQDKNIWVGKSKVSTAPMGMIVRSLIEDGFKPGMSTRGLGTVAKNGWVNEDFSLITIDVVGSPSGPGCYVSAITENKEYIIKEDGTIAEIAYEQFEKKLETLPKQLTEAHLWQAVNEFLKGIK